MFFPFICRLLFFVLFSVMFVTAYSQDSDSSYHPDLRQDAFIKNKFHYLNVPRVGTFTVYDIFDCTFACLSNPSCLSLNLAASKGADGKLWCELLSSEKYSNPKEYKGNMSSHHFSMKPPACLSSPCQNGGTCVDKHRTFECRCKEGLVGEHCEKVLVAKSCQELYNRDPFKSYVSQVVTLILDSKPTSVLCHMGDFGCGDGGWTPVIKMDGNKQTFQKNSNLWSNKNTFNLEAGKTGFDTQETKLPSYWNTSFSKICLGMNISQQAKFVVITMKANSLYSLIADGQYRAISLGRNTWKSLTGSQASLQPNCNKEGFNVACTNHNRAARIGIFGNNENDCHTCDSSIAFGSAINPICGDWQTRGIGYILVQ